MRADLSPARFIAAVASAARAAAHAAFETSILLRRGMYTLDVEDREDGIY